MSRVGFYIVILWAKDDVLDGVVTLLSDRRGVPLVFGRKTVAEDNAKMAMALRDETWDRFLVVDLSERRKP